MVFLPRGPPPPAAPAAFIQGLVFPGTLERPVKPVKGQNNRGATVGVDRRGRPAGYRRWRCTSLAPWRAIRASTCRASRSEEHTSELQSLMRISYAVCCLKTTKYYSSLILS